MTITELQMVSFTLGRKTRLQQLLKQCGVYATAKHLRNKGYSLQQALDLVAVNS